MLTVSEAYQIILQNLIDLPIENIISSQAYHKILMEDIFADRDFPPFDRVTMDGIAIQYNTWQNGQKQFRIQATQFAGKPTAKLENPTEAIEIMTGAVLPEGTDMVIRFEDLEIENIDNQRFAKILVDNIQLRQNIHAQGIDNHKGDLLIPKGTLLGSPEIAVAVSVGKTSLQVCKPPRVAIISNGDELVDTGIMPLPYQVRRSNVYAVATALSQNRIPNELFHFPDQKAMMQKGIAYILDTFDILILSGGVSQGKADYIPEILKELGVQKLFHKVRQRPGKPFWFGKKDNKVVFALPGNPVSTIACFYKYALPYIFKIMGNTQETSLKAQLGEDFNFEPDLSLFLPVKVQTNELGNLIAQPFAGNGSGDFTNLLNGDGFLELPHHQSRFKKGESFDLIRYR